MDIALIVLDLFGHTSIFNTQISLISTYDGHCNNHLGLKRSEIVFLFFVNLSDGALTLPTKSSGGLQAF